MNIITTDACVELGFIEKIEPWKLRSKFFPCKVGGFPAWLGLESLPSDIDLQCRKCQKPASFLFQLYAPITSNENCFHRMIFVFICCNGVCSSENDASNLRIFRSQLPRNNKYYSFDPPKEEEAESDCPSAKNWVKLCRVCGCSGSKLCGGCKLASYCSRDHQAADWKAGHKSECKTKELVNSPSVACKDILFPENEIDLEPEELEASKEKTDEQIMEEYEEILRRGQANNIVESELDEKDVFKMASKETDKQFAKFRSRISQYPEQVIRYERGGQPLFVSSENEPKEIPNCENCGAERNFEFQIMPQLLVHLKVDNPGHSIDWGTVLVYTCSQSCSKEGVLYVPEIAFKQDYSPSTDFLKQ